MAKGRKATGTPATVQLAAAGVPFTEHTYEHDPRAASYGLEAAQALGVDAARVFKTILIDVDSRLAVAIVPVQRRVDVKAVAAALTGKRAAVADPAAAERSTGYVVGGISPFGQKRPLPTVLDDSAARHATIFVSGGRRGLDVEVTPGDLTAVCRGILAPIARD